MKRVKPIRECYNLARGCDHNEDMECYAPVRDHIQCQIEVEDEAMMSEWERQHEPPDSELGENSE